MNVPGPIDTLAPDDVIGGYELLRRIGKGGMAEVWVARRSGRTSKYVAIKVIAPHLAGQDRYSRMFRAEAELSAMLSHSNIVQVFDEGEDRGVSYLVMEWVDGINLVRLREALKFIDDDETRFGIIAFVTGQLLHALGYAHSVTTTEGNELGIVHRDVSPQNVLISNSGDIKLTDFGIAHTVIEESSHLHVKGKLRYMSPEQLAGKTKEPTIDLYAAGAILHELIEGEKFRGEFDDERVLHAQVLGGVIPELSNPCPPELDRVRVGLLEPDEKKRLQSADEALSLLREFSGYRDMRMEIAKICGSLTGVSRPRTGPGGPDTPRPRAKSGKQAPSRQTPARGSGPAASKGGPSGPEAAAPAQRRSVPSAPAFAGLGLPADQLPESTVLMPEMHEDGGAPSARMTPPREETAYLPDGGLPNAVTPAPKSGGDTEFLPPPPSPDEEATSTSQHAMMRSAGPDGWPEEADGPEPTGHTRFEIPQRRSPVILIAGLGLAALLGGIGTALYMAWGMGEEDETPIAALDKEEQAGPAEPAGPAPQPEPIDAADDQSPEIPGTQPEVAVAKPTSAPAPAPTIDGAAEADAPAEPSKPAAAEAAEPEPEPAPKAGPQPETKPTSSSARRAKRPSCNVAEEGAKVMVHFRLDGVDAAKVKLQGHTVNVRAGANKRIDPGKFSIRYQNGGRWRSAGCKHFKPGEEYVVAVSPSGAKLYTFKQFMSR